jgi:phosphocarrier protein FPr/phosphocarrier protein
MRGASGLRTMSALELLAPFAAWAAPLDEVPDPAFAERMLGDGLALDPLEGIVRAPCDGVVAAVAPTGHSVTLRAANGAEILIHIGVDTVTLGGAGFAASVAEGARVRAGETLLTFDLDAVARRARSLLSPMIVPGEGFQMLVLARDRTVRAGDPVCRLEPREEAAAPAEATGPVVTAPVAVSLPSGLHARPAGRIVAALKPLAAEVELTHAQRRANGRSVTAMLALGLRQGDQVIVSARGGDAPAAVAAVAALLSSHAEEGLAPPADPARLAAEPIAPGETPAVRAAPGGATGRVFHLRGADRALPDRAGAPAEEESALLGAMNRLRGELERAAGRDDIAGAHLAILDDPELIAAAEAAIRGGNSAARGWREATRAQVAAIRATGNPLLIERIADLIDIERRLIDLLLGAGAGEEAGADKRIDIPEQSILVADDLLPSDFLAIDRSRLAGIVTAEGGPTSHVAILAASRGVPMLVAAGAALLDVADGTVLSIDHERPVFCIDPPAAMLERHRAAGARRQAAARAAERAARQPCHTADGVRIEVFANCGSAQDAAIAAERGAEGCGLLRTEFLFLDRPTPPGRAEQARIYRDIAGRLAGRPVIVRTLDAGSDKPIAYLPMPREENPALGLRGIRLALRNPELLREQLRAVIEGVPSDQRRIMLPMVNDLDDFRRARALLREVEADYPSEPPVPLGVMIETPAAAIMAGELAGEADFLSIGTNDLTQYALAADRGNAGVGAAHDALHPAVLRLIAMTAEGARRHGRWLGICGAVAGEPADAPLLIGLGAVELSAPPHAIPALKQRIAAVSLDSCKALAAEALAEEDAAGVRRVMTAMDGR